MKQTHIANVNALTKLSNCFWRQMKGDSIIWKLPIRLENTKTSKVIKTKLPRYVFWTKVWKILRGCHFLIIRMGDSVGRGKKRSSKQAANIFESKPCILSGFTLILSADVFYAPCRFYERSDKYIMETLNSAKPRSRGAVIVLISPV